MLNIFKKIHTKTHENQFLLLVNLGAANSQLCQKVSLQILSWTTLCVIIVLGLNLKLKTNTYLRHCQTPIMELYCFCRKILL